MGPPGPVFIWGAGRPAKSKFDRTTAVVSRSNFLRTVEFPTFVIDAPFSLDRLPRALARILALALLAVLLGACTFLRIGYPHLDTYAASVADDYFDLDLRQKQEFRTRFDRLHAWHRYEQLPDYVSFLTETKTRVERGVTRADVAWAIGGVQERYRTIMQRSADDAAVVLMTITPEQLNGLQRRWDKDNRRFTREYRLDDGVEEQRKAAVRRTLSRVREWAGSLTPEQEAKITAMVSELPPMHGLRHEDRMRRQKEFMKLMRSRGDDPRQFSARLRHYLINWEEGRDPRYDRVFKESTEKQAELYVAIGRMLTPAQRAAVTRRLQGYIDDLARLSQRPGVAAQPTASR
jgi:hypothetical protein